MSSSMHETTFGIHFHCRKVLSQHENLLRTRTKNFRFFTWWRKISSGCLRPEAPSERSHRCLGKAQLATGPLRTNHGCLTESWEITGIVPWRNFDGHKNLIIASEAVLGNAPVFSWDCEVFFASLTQVQPHLPPRLVGQCWHQDLFKAILRAVRNIACCMITLVVPLTSLYTQVHSNLQSRILLPL